MLNHESLERAFSQLSKRFGIAFAWIDERNRPLWIDATARAMLGMKDGDESLPGVLVEALEQNARARAEGRSMLRSTSLAIPQDGPRRVVSWFASSAGEAEPKLLFVETEAGMAHAAQNSRLAASARDVHRLARKFGHDLRTPLNAMHLHLVLLETLLDDAGPERQGPPVQKTKTLEAVRREIRRIDEVAQEFVSMLSRPEDSSTEADLRETVERAIGDVQPVLQYAGVHCALIDPGKPVMLKARHDLLRHGITNLLIGAVDDARIDQFEIRIDAGADGVRLHAGGCTRSSSDPRGASGSRNAISPPFSMRARVRRAIASEDIEEAGGRLSVTDAPDVHGFEIVFTP